MNRAALTLTSVTKRFGSGPCSTLALDRVTLDVVKGEFVSLIGPSGCGKTTILRIVGGLTDQTLGEVTIFGESPHQLQIRHEIGVAFQRSALEPSRTALKNVELTLEVTEPRNRDRSKAQELLVAFGLEDALHKYPHELSGGMQQRVNIAAALVHNPSVLLLDEPFGALDLLTRDMMAEWLGSVLLATPKTALFVTHSDESVFAYGQGSSRSAL
ncbi:ATP-binding cassette domain-containing protein [Candidatus Gottesmanbacteria bacterium]|nr:ATP-binding cassette domain-containing protein [Candidatus Gottesmanbacteria bacterium]